ncbi:transposase [Patescibacteria group bacterium]|nr:transposase [Patescibacteria group bacterium]
MKNSFGPLIPNSISSIVNHFKGVVTRWCRNNNYLNFAWQSRFHDRVIRDEDEFNRICAYIMNNPQGWDGDRNNQGDL